MKSIIRNIEIRYFRSIYVVRIRGLSSLNILSGRNDSGKSNVLKALNLFFNKQTDWHTALDFYRDFSFKRLAEVRKESIKGKQFISIEIEFNRPKNYEGSLPETFKVKRKWHRDSREYTETNNLEQYAKQLKLPTKNIGTARKSLAQFMNRIHFEYVPAVKERAYFGHLLSILQKNLLDIPLGSDTSISTVAVNLAEHLQNKVIDLNKDFERATGIKSNIEPPQEVAGLFQAFQVATESATEKIPLSLRGDGIQGRYVPSVLQYISKKSSHFFIWGFEEPENSLEYSHVIELAEDFHKRYTNSAQIIITTHSPAFTSLRNNNTCYRIFQTNGVSDIRQIYPQLSSDSEELNQFNLEMGFLKIQETLHDEFKKRVEELELIRKRVKILEQEIIDAHKPLVLTEGKFDKIILELAWSKLYPNVECPFLIRDSDTTPQSTSGGSGGASSLAKMIESIHPEEDRLAIAIFDRDVEGIKSFTELSRNFHEYDNQKDIKEHTNGFSFAMLLPVPPGLENYALQNNLPIEYFFNDTVLNLKNDNGKGLTFDETKVDSITVNGRKLNQDQFSLFVKPDINQVTELRKIKDGKNIFVNDILPILEPSEFENIKYLFDQIAYILLDPEAIKKQF